MLGLNRDGKIVQFDKACQQLTGYKRTEALNKKIWDFLIPTPYITKWKKLFDSAIKNGDIGNFEIPWKTSDGKEILISWSSLPLENKKGNVKNICFIGKNLDNKQNGESSEVKRQDKNKNMMLHIHDDNKPVDNEMRDFKKRAETHPNKLNKLIRY